MSSSPIQSVAGIVFSSDRKKVLLIQRKDVPVWVLPGGGVEINEDPESAILREILEETGLTVKIRRIVALYHPINRLAKKTYLYECTFLEGKLTTSFESKEVAFFPIDQLPDPMPPPYAEWINDSLIIGPMKEKKLTSVTYKTLISSFFSHPILVLRFILARLGLPINR